VLLLDTHVWIWSMAADTRRLGRRARQMLGRAEVHDEIRVSPASVFEVTSLHTAGRLHLDAPADRWVRDSLSAPGVRLAELTATIAIDAGVIPRGVLPDPLDRILVGTARQLGATLITADGPILEYASRTGHVRVHDARL
jgi:PIN domain nuclease of toxin-antitoxin system